MVLNFSMVNALSVLVLCPITHSCGDFFCSPAVSGMLIQLCYPGMHLALVYGNDIIKRMEFNTIISFFFAFHPVIIYLFFGLFMITKVSIKNAISVTEFMKIII